MKKEGWTMLDEAFSKVYTKFKLHFYQQIFTLCKS